MTIEEMCLKRIDTASLKGSRGKQLTGDKGRNNYRQSETCFN